MRRRTLEDEEDKEPFAFTQKYRLLFRRGHFTQSANLDSGISHTVRYTKSVRQLVTRLGLCSRSGLPVRAETASTCWVFTLNSFVMNLILALNYYAVPLLLICSLSGSRPEEARVVYLETRGALNRISIQGISQKEVSS